MPVFEAAGLQARELVEAELPALQALYDANPGYWQVVNGGPPPPDLARQEFDERPPPHLGWRARGLLGLWDGAHLAGVVEWVSDLPAPGVWHLGLMLLEDARHGRGQAAAVLAALERLARGDGAAWMRLGVVAGNLRAERFWVRHGFVQARVREGVDTGGRLNTLRVMVKPLAGGTIDDYHRLVPRDQPGSPLP